MFAKTSKSFTESRFFTQRQPSALRLSTALAATGLNRTGIMAKALLAYVHSGTSQLGRLGATAPLIFATSSTIARASPPIFADSSIGSGGLKPSQLFWPSGGHGLHLRIVESWWVSLSSYEVFALDWILLSFYSVRGKNLCDISPIKTNYEQNQILNFSKISNVDHRLLHRILSKLTVTGLVVFL